MERIALNSSTLACCSSESPAAIFSQFAKAAAPCSIRIIFISPAARAVRYRRSKSNPFDSASSETAVLVRAEKKPAGKLTHRVSHQLLSRCFCLNSSVVILKRQLNFIFALRVARPGHFVRFVARNRRVCIRRERFFVGNMGHAVL